MSENDVRSHLDFLTGMQPPAPPARKKNGAMMAAAPKFPADPAEVAPWSQDDGIKGFGIGEKVTDDPVVTFGILTSAPPMIGIRVTVGSISFFEKTEA